METMGHLFSFLFTKLTCSGAEVIRLTSDTTITANDVVYEAKDLIIDHCRVTVDGKHRFHSLQLINQAILTHPACTSSNVYAVELEIAQNLSIDTNSKMDASSRGYLPGRTSGNSSVGGATGSAGGSYGGWVVMGRTANRTGSMATIAIQVNRELEQGRIIREVRVVASSG